MLSSKTRHILSAIHFTIRGAVCFQFTHFSCDYWENIYAYYHHQIGSMNYYPLFRVRSWNNGVRCMSFCILMAGTDLIMRYAQLTYVFCTDSISAPRWKLFVLRSSRWYDVGIEFTECVRKSQSRCGMHSSPAYVVCPKTAIFGRDLPHPVLFWAFVISANASRDDDATQCLHQFSLARTYVKSNLLHACHGIRDRLCQIGSHRSICKYILKI